MANKDTVLTPTFRAVFPNLFKARRNDLNDKDEFSVVALFKKGEDLTALKKAAENAIVEKWGADKKKWPKNLKTPFRLQDEKEKVDEDSGEKYMPAGYEKGAVFMNLKSQFAPQIIDGKRQDIIDESEIYSGVYLRASVRAFAYEMKGNAGVSFGLGNVQKVKDGDKLGGRPKAQNEFQAIDDSEDAPSESASDIFG